MGECQQKKRSQDSPPRETSNREHVAIFSGKCYMLADLMKDTEIHPQLKKDLLESMFRQSVRIIGEQ